MFFIFSFVFTWRHRNHLFYGFIGAYIISFYFLNFMGIGVLYFQLDAYRQEIGISDPVIIIKMLIFSILAFGTVLGIYVFLSPSTTRKNVKPTLARQRERYLAAALTLYSAFTVLQYVRNLDGMAIFLALAGEFDAALVSRSDMSNNYGSLHLIRLGLQQLPMMLFYFIYLSVPRAHIFNKLLLVGLFGVVAFVLSISTEKFAVIQFIIGILFLRQKYVACLSIRGLLTWGAAVIVIIVFFYKAFSGIDETALVLRVAASRIFTGSIGTAHFYLEYFPSIHPFLYGRSLPNPMGIFPWDSVSAAVEIMNWKFPHFLEKGIVGSSPSTFWAEGYANFGVVGVILSALYIGTLIALAQRVFNQYSSFLFIRAVEGWFFAYIFAVNISGVSEYMKITVLIPLIFLLTLPRLRWK